MAETMRKDRLGLVLVAASLLAIAVVGALIYRYQVQVHRTNVRVNGIAITRAIAGMESAGNGGPLLAGVDRDGLLRSMVSIQNDDNLSYLVVVSPSGTKLRELVSRGSIAPAAVMPTEPFAWFGEHSLVSPGDSLSIREFYAPVMSEGRLAGFVRAGYFDSPWPFPASHLSLMGLMAMPIFLLTTLAYFLIRREIEPLTRLGEQMNSMSHSFGGELPNGAMDGNKREFLHRFDVDKLDYSDLH
jgi:hypothetical protein